MAGAQLYSAIEALGVVPFTGEAFRHQAAKYDPLSGAGARSQGGRWNPPNSFSTLYVALASETAIAEFHRMAQKAGVPPAGFLPRRLYRYDLRLQAVLDLRPAEARQSMGLPVADLGEADLAQCQAVGDAAHQLGREAILAPSAADAGSVLAVFLDRLDPASAISVIDFVDWTAPPS